ncbi:hypothetical protein, partial [Robiginitalea sp. SC105]|uniref:hypothetical protein n=1 Tax=Robiginitalea sp. SC105 TaxID=2762332 RepID=UPI00163B5FDA
ANTTLINNHIAADLDLDDTNEIELPTGGVAGQFLETDGAGNYSWADGANTDDQTVDLFNIDGSNLLNLSLEDDGAVPYTVDLSPFEESADIAANTTLINNHIAADLDVDDTNEIELPTGGVAGQFLETDGAGNYSWADGANTDDQTAREVGINFTPSSYTVSDQNTNTAEDVEDHLVGIDNALSGLSNTNFAENNLTLTAMRTHNMNGNDLIFGGTGGSMGIGNFGGGTLPSVPQSKLDVDGQIQARIGFAAWDGDATEPAYGFYQGGDTNMGMYRIGPDNLGFSTNSTEAMRIDASQNVGIAQPTPLARLHVGGDIRADGDFISMNTTIQTPDYVFQSYFTGTSNLNPEYQMPNLDEVRAFVKKNHHLPGVTSAAEVEAQGGIILNHATTQNLEKIEELFLHTIEQEQKIEALKAENQSMGEELDELKTRMAEIEKMLGAKPDAGGKE